MGFDAFPEAVEKLLRAHRTGGIFHELNVLHAFQGDAVAEIERVRVVADIEADFGNGQIL